MAAAILSHGAHLQMVLPTVDQMPEDLDEVWRRTHYQSMSMPMNHYWPQSHAPAVVGMHDADIKMFHGGHEYDTQFYHDTSSAMSPRIGYVPDANFGSDMDVNTPSTPGFPDTAQIGYSQIRLSNQDQQLQPVAAYERAPSAHSPQSSISGVSPHQTFARLADVTIKEERPNLSRSITAPAAPGQIQTQVRHSTRKPPTIPSISPSIKRSNSEETDDGDDDDYVPDTVTTHPSKPHARGRKRQRIPHTAVERRYRENLNKHLDKLRQTVPSLKREEGAGVKPSKCEVLNGAIEHIRAQGVENMALRAEVKALRGRLEEVERVGRRVDVGDVGDEVYVGVLGWKCGGVM